MNPRGEEGEGKNKGITKNGEKSRYVRELLHAGVKIHSLIAHLCLTYSGERR